MLQPRSDGDPSRQHDLVVAVCTNRLSNLARRWRQNLSELRRGEFLAVIDLSWNDDVATLAAAIEGAGGRVVCHGSQRGLSAARNTVLDLHPSSKVLFIDDDVVVPTAAIEQTRAAFASGAGIVGARLAAPPEVTCRHWFFSEGQMHLVGWHSPGAAVKTWGGFMGVDASIACRHGIRFDARLGRTGRRLESGDDTSFVSALKVVGARETIIQSPVTHAVDPSRLSLSYLLRRSYWQGRSEVRRRNSWGGLRKEWLRHRRGRRWPLLAFVYLTAFVVGVLHELMSAVTAMGLQSRWQQIVVARRRLSRTRDAGT